MNIPSSILTMLAGIAVTLVSLWYGQHHGLMPAAASEDAPLVDGLFDTMMIISTGLFILVQGAIILAAIKFRRQPGDLTDGPPIEGNIPLEILWTAIPAVIVMGIAIYSFDVYNDLGGIDPMTHASHSGHGSAPQMQTAQAGETSKPAHHSGAAIAAPLVSQAEMAAPETAVPETAAPETAPTPSAKPSSLDAGNLTIDVKGLQYAWLFTYPEGFISGELHLPVNREVVLNISANDVIHAFWVPEYRVKQDAIPGRTTQLHFKPTQLGDYPVICAELCGPYHGGMKTRVMAETPTDFANWVATQTASMSASAEIQGKNLNQAIALDSGMAPHSESDQPGPESVLEPWVEHLGISPDLLRQIHS
jgi:cytochrome c oxidase subunit II